MAFERPLVACLLVLLLFIRFMLFIRFIAIPITP